MTLRDAELRDVVQAELHNAARTLGREAPPLTFTIRARNASSDGIKVTVNPTWLEGALFNSGLRAPEQRVAVLGIMGHELGHHFDPTRSPERWMRERYADTVAGYVLGRNGHHEGPLLAVLAVLPFSPNHPPLYQRAAYMRLGRSRS